MLHVASFKGREGDKCWRIGQKRREVSVEIEVERGNEGGIISQSDQRRGWVEGNYRMSWLAPATHHLLQQHTCPLSVSVIETAAIQLPDSRSVSSAGAEEEKIIHFQVLDPPLWLHFVFFLTFSIFSPNLSICLSALVSNSRHNSWSSSSLLILLHFFWKFWGWECFHLRTVNVVCIWGHITG